jgi:ATP-dependent DNA helicase DinG
VIKFKQGFGRLIRSKDDDGIVVALDSRLATKGYGQQFLESLPNPKIKVADRATLMEAFESFLY